MRNIPMALAGALLTFGVLHPVMADQWNSIPTADPWNSIPTVDGNPIEVRSGSVTFSTLKPYVTKGLAAMEQARAICFQHSAPTGTLLACVPYRRMCNRAYEEAWKEPCWAIDKKWDEGDYQDASERAQRMQDDRDLRFVRDVANEDR